MTRERLNDTHDATIMLLPNPDERAPDAQRSVFDYACYRDFLRDAFETQRKLRPRLSTRGFAKICGLKSPSYFQMVINGERKPTTATLKRFALGLRLSDFDTVCLLAAHAVEEAKTNAEREANLRFYEKLRHTALNAKVMDSSHVRILADPLLLKLYVLGQKSGLTYDHATIAAHFPPRVRAQIPESCVTLIDAGLWHINGERIDVLAPKLITGDQRLERDLVKTHQRLIREAFRALTTQSGHRRVTLGRTFLVDPNQLGAIKERIDSFLQTLESEFESLEASSVYQAEVCFFELLPESDEPSRKF